MSLPWTFDRRLALGLQPTPVLGLLVLLLGVALGRLHPGLHLAATLEAERLGFESVWLPEHLVFPIDMGGSPFPGQDHPPVPPTTPVFDAFAMLSFLAGKTERVRLGTHVYLLGHRHPFVSARSMCSSRPCR